MATAHRDVRLGGIPVPLSRLILAAALGASFVSGMVVATQIAGGTGSSTAIDRGTAAVFDAVQFRAEERQPLSVEFDAVRFRQEERGVPSEPAR